MIGKLIYYGLGALEVGLKVYDEASKRLQARKRRKQAEKQRRDRLVRKINEP